MGTGTITRAKTRTGTATQAGRKRAGAANANGAAMSAPIATRRSATSIKAAVNASTNGATQSMPAPEAQAAASSALRWLRKQFPAIPPDFGWTSSAEGRRARNDLASVIDGAYGQPAAPRARSGTK